MVMQGLLSEERRFETCIKYKMAPLSHAILSDRTAAFLNRRKELVNGAVSCIQVTFSDSHQKWPNINRSVSIGLFLPPLVGQKLIKNNDSECVGGHCGGGVQVLFTKLKLNGTALTEPQVLWNWCQAVFSSSSCRDTVCKRQHWRCWYRRTSLYILSSGGVGRPHAFSLVA